MQSVAASLPATLLLLSGQPVQDVAVFVLPLYWPPGQDPQEPEELPATSHPESFSPAGQLVHSEQDVSVFVLPLYWPVSQLTHDIPLLFFPEPHSFTQGPPSGPYQLALHLQSALWSEP